MKTFLYFFKDLFCKTRFLDCKIFFESFGKKKNVSIVQKSKKVEQFFTKKYLKI